MEFIVFGVLGALSVTPIVVFLDNTPNKGSSMKLSPIVLSNPVEWLIRLRWFACAGVVVIIWMSSSVFEIVAGPMPLYVVATAMVFYNSLLKLSERRRGRSQTSFSRNIVLQMVMDQISLTLLLYFSSLPHNPFIFYFVFHMIIATLLLHGRAPYCLAALASLLVGGVLVLEYLDRIPVYRLRFAGAAMAITMDRLYLAGFFLAFSSTLWVTVYFTSAVHRYMHRAQAMVRQKEKMLGIGQLVASIAHQICNPLDGIQNCLSTIGKSVEGDEHLTHYVRLMTEALDRIERTAKRVQSIARPRGLRLQGTDVNKAVTTTVELIGQSNEFGVSIVTEFGQIPLVMGDPYTLQEVIFNLCTNALAAMPNGGTLTIRTYLSEDEVSGHLQNATIEVTDTGTGIREGIVDKIFEPFFTTRADAGGTGLGLGLCRMLILEMGGGIEVESEVGKGTTFRIILKRSDVESDV